MALWISRNAIWSAQAIQAMDHPFSHFGSRHFGSDFHVTCSDLSGSGSQFSSLSSIAFSAFLSFCIVAVIAVAVGFRSFVLFLPCCFVFCTGHSGFGSLPCFLVVPHWPFRPWIKDFHGRERPGFSCNAPQKTGWIKQIGPLKKIYIYIYIYIL